MHIGVRNANYQIENAHQRDDSIDVVHQIEVIEVVYVEPSFLAKPTQIIIHLAILKIDESTVLDL